MGLPETGELTRAKSKSRANRADSSVLSVNIVCTIAVEREAAAFAWHRQSEKYRVVFYHALCALYQKMCCKLCKQYSINTAYYYILNYMLHEHESIGICRRPSDTETEENGRD